MINQLSFVIRSSPILNGVSQSIVDFEIDSESIWQRMRRLQPELMACPQTANPDGTFVGVSTWVVRDREGAYQYGHHPRHLGQWSYLLPLLACSDCGWEGCGGIWTRIFVGPKRVFWSGLALSVAGEGFGPIYDKTTFVFDREEYDTVITELIDRVQASDFSSEQFEPDAL